MLLTPMKIHYCHYSNFHHDPNPVLFVLHSDSKYCEGLNLRYLPSSQRGAFYAMVRRLRSAASGRMVYNGVMMYSIFKRYYPQFSKIAYRKYFSVYITGTMINDALNPVSPLMELYMKTQNLIANATSNFLEMRSRGDLIAKEVNTALYETRADAYKQQQSKIYDPNRPATPPGTVTPNQVPPSTIRNIQPIQPGTGGLPNENR